MGRASIVHHRPHNLSSRSRSSPTASGWLGPDHPATVAITVNNLASVLGELGDLAGARRAHERALAITEAAYGPDHPAVAVRVSNLASVLWELGDLAGARQGFERALRIITIAWGPDHPHAVASARNLRSPRLTIRQDHLW